MYDVSYLGGLPHPRKNQEKPPKKKVCTPSEQGQEQGGCKAEGAQAGTMVVPSQTRTSLKAHAYREIIRHLLVVSSLPFFALLVAVWQLSKAKSGLFLYLQSHVIRGRN